MTALSHVKAMAFFNASSFDTAYGFAERFAGEGGHVATLPEIISARASSQHESSYIWRNWFTSSSSEYYGHSKQGAPIIIVAHGVGPLLGLDSIKQAYKPTKLRADGRPDDNGEGRISLEQFRLLEEGHYGEVTVVEVAQIEAVYRYAFLSAASMEEAQRDPLLQARLGSYWRLALEHMQDSSIREGVQFAGLAPKVIASEGPAAYYVKKASEGWPFGHLLSIGSDMHVRACQADGGDRISFDVYCHSRSDSKRFIGVRPGGDVKEVHAGPSKLGENREQLAMFNQLPAEKTGFFALKQLGNQWFTQVPKRGCSMDTGWPEYPISELEIVGATGKIVALGETFFFRYDVEDVIKQAPAGANAYYVSSEPYRTTVGGEDAIVSKVVFCRVVLDESRKVPAQDVLNSDYELQLMLLERLEDAESVT